MSTSSSSPLKPSPTSESASTIPVLQRVKDVHAWRKRAFEARKSVGYVPTMGALHAGHLSLVKRSLEENDLTVVSIFVNPTQFAPHEDLAAYPRTLPADLAALEAVSVSVPSSDQHPDPGTGSDSMPATTATRTTSLVFAPTPVDMYPSLSLSSSSSLPNTGTTVDPGALGLAMEGAARPHFFRGVATVVTKLLSTIQPTRAYFGQKDIQQALLLRRVVADLCLAYPGSEGVHVVETAREGKGEEDEVEGLALSSRNVYLSAKERRWAATLYKALSAGSDAWLRRGCSKAETLARVRAVAERRAESAKTEDGVEVRLEYVEMNDPETFAVVGDGETQEGGKGMWDVVILSGAMWVGRTRLIDNVLLGDAKSIIY